MRRLIRSVRCGFLACALVAGCSSNENPPPNRIGPAGGTVSSSDGKLRVIVPAGALAAETEITISVVSSPPAGSLTPVYRLGPDGTAFSKQVTLELSYAGADAEEKLLRVANWVEGGWLRLPLEKLDPTVKTVSGTTWHLSDYGLVEEPKVPCSTGCPSRCEGGGVTVGSCHPVVGYCVYEAKEYCQGYPCFNGHCATAVCLNDEGCTPSCAGDFRVTGTCIKNECAYNKGQNCAALGQGCVGGNCVKLAECKGNEDCPDKCNGAAWLQYFRCDEGKCRDGGQFNCAAEGKTCEGGACVTLGCKGDADCLPRCRGSIIEKGTCNLSSGCSYDDGEDCAASLKQCSNGSCVDQPCKGPADCPAGCLGDKVAQGVCQNGLCQFSAGEDCAAKGQQCTKGSCAPKPCQGDFDCPAECADASKVQLKQCIQGICVPAGTTDCGASQQVCSNGKCAPKPCQGPADCPALCAGNVVFAGSCTGGGCVYQSAADCAAKEQICSGGKCVPKPCVNANDCLPFCDGDKAMQGSCSGGACDYQLKEDCAAKNQTCSGGGCTAKSCAGEADCPSICLNSTDILDYSCNNGSCVAAGTYFCGAQFKICSGATCIDKPCIGPADCPPDCAGSTVKLGTCTYSGCSYADGPTCNVNEQICKAGACVAKPCTQDADCESYCNGQVPRTATCTSGACTYANGTDCALLGKTCVDGACVGKACSKDSECPGQCQGTVLSPGKCTTSSFCDVGTPTDCATTYQICSSGACVFSDAATEFCYYIIKACPEPMSNCIASVKKTPTQTYIDCAKAATSCPTTAPCWQGLL